MEDPKKKWISKRIQPQQRKWRKDVYDKIQECNQQSKNNEKVQIE